MFKIYKNEEKYAYNWKKVPMGRYYSKQYSTTATNSDFRIELQ